jgi:hypothetical protein
MVRSSTGCRAHAARPSDRGLQGRLQTHPLGSPHAPPATSTPVADLSPHTSAGRAAGSTPPGEEMTPTSAATDCLCSALELDFAETCNQLAEARHRRSQKDSTSNRNSIDECRARIDTVLDLYLEAEGSWSARRGRTG